MVAYTRVVTVEATKSDSGCIFTTEPKELAEGLDGRCEKKRGTKDCPWSRTRAIVWMVVPSARWETPEEKVAGQTGELSFRHIKAVMLIQCLGRAVEQAAVAASLYSWGRAFCRW